MLQNNCVLGSQINKLFTIYKYTFITKKDTSLAFSHNTNTYENCGTNH